MSFPFFNLPRELRAIVYRFATDDEPSFSTFEVPCHLPATAEDIGGFELQSERNKEFFWAALSNAQRLQQNSSVVADHPLAFASATTFNEYAEEYRLVTGKAVPLACVIGSTHLSAAIVPEPPNFLGSAVRKGPGHDIGLATPMSEAIATVSAYWSTMDIQRIRLHYGQDVVNDNEPRASNFESFPHLQELEFIDNSWTGSGEKSRGLRVIRQLCGELLTVCKDLKKVSIAWNEGVTVELVREGNVKWCDKLALQRLREYSREVERRGGHCALWNDAKIKEIKKLMERRRRRALQDATGAKENSS